MIIVPEIERVFITPPRTASSSLRSALKAKFPETFTPYRHMEADGVPHGYDRWKRFGIVRDPIHRLTSLYRYMNNPTFSRPHAETPAWEREAKRVSALSFDEWLQDRWVFTNPYDSDGSLKYWSRYTVLHSLPEQRKSQFVYCRPDLGTHIIRFNDLANWLLNLYDIQLPQQNGSDPRYTVNISDESMEFIRRYHEWDLMFA